MTRATAVAVVGGGAMGGTFAARLAASGQHVTVVDVAADVVAAIQRDGLVVEAPEGEIRARPEATCDPASTGVVDLVFIFVKAQHTAAAAGLLGPLVGPSTVVATLQNGWGNADVLAGAVPASQLVVGVTYHSATLLGPGRVRHSGQGATFIGPYAIGSPLSGADAVGRALSQAGIEATVTADVKTEIWRKLVLNAATLPTAALTLLRAGELGQAGPLLDVVDGLAAEAVAVARAQGLAIDLDERLERIHQVLAGAGTGKPLMLQDVEARRKTEVERINGAIVHAAAAAGVDVPLNRAMVALIGGLERSWTGAG